MAKWIKANSEIIEVKPTNGTDFSLEELQGFVGGYIEIVYLDSERIMVVNEEGIINDLPFNEKASSIVGQLIAGDVLVCKSEEVR